MSVETWCHAFRGRPADRAWLLPPQPALSPGRTGGATYRRRQMNTQNLNLLPGLRKVLDDLAPRFGAHIEEARAPRPNELYLHTKLEVAGAFCSTFYKKYQGRLAGVFAEDVRAEQNVFFVYYLYALDFAHGFVLVRVPISSDQPQLTSLSNAIPAVNWQEREIQDLFGIRLVGHPNPSRCALHDDWPNVHP